ncbi:DnaJ-domain-containing protein [Coprinopsis marcescibilis]|uniref:Diphthamide biosynthesis protein 4 n=1 Tax=Coprinopsis marcescibilis TaxID=230819 RepID=A0A5C3L2A2_COPMA|nr:DnaJ-domain-containing protein [Coprinopsis marcescibilis]
MLSQTEMSEETPDAWGSTNYYDVLSTQCESSDGEIKAAYHRALLRHHPDKQQNRDMAIKKAEKTVEISLIQEAFTVLSDAKRRLRHDAELKKRSTTHAPRPAQVVSLEEWTSIGSGDEEEEGPWRYPCRCGGQYRLTVDMMEADDHLIGCDSCSEVVWAGYELQGDEDEKI